MGYNLQEVKERTNCIELAEKFVELTTIVGNGKEGYGPCPRCGGVDRFHVFPHGWFCRKCRPYEVKGYGDCFDLLTELMGYDFYRAVDLLGGQWEDKDFGKTKTARQREQFKRMDRGDWRKDYGKFYLDSVAHLHNSTAALTYLLGRGIAETTINRFGLGFAQVPLPGTWDKTARKHILSKQPAIIIPWFDGNGELVGLRYRFLEAHTYTTVKGKEERNVKKSGAFDSDFTGPDMFGWLAGEDDPADCELMLVEGELNCLSVWQEFNGTRLHVRSFGSEVQPIPAQMVSKAQGYRRVYIWTDQRDKLTRKFEQLPNAVGLCLPGFQDANDLLQAGLLGWTVGLLRFKQCKTRMDYITLLSDLMESSDPGIKAVCKKIDAELAKAYA